MSTIHVSPFHCSTGYIRRPRNGIVLDHFCDPLLRGINHEEGCFEIRKLTSLVWMILDTVNSCGPRKSPIPLLKHEDQSPDPRALLHLRAGMPPCRVKVGWGLA